ncbi:hypothetical protein D9756_007051 [Leucocoprinus leucothites]|uniref:Cytochrome P450 n=1 Tax=Leucocoprinus leucothites TaxID=201217 RepID=A0A8H5D788_9AGAR|nr:hypothetical protein D9756_007051 [Leucoagaricus leucothites]
MAPFRIPFLVIPHPLGNSTLLTNIQNWVINKTLSYSKPYHGEGSDHVFLLYHVSPICCRPNSGLAVLRSASRPQTQPDGLPLPPGPRGYPVIDNLLDFPTFKPWLVYAQWSKIYGDMIYFKVLGQPFLVLDSLEKTYDLFERRSSNYSDRTRLPMLNELMEWTWNFALMPYGTVWRRHRRVFHDHFHPNVVHKYHDIQAGTARAFLRQLLKTPDDFMEHIRHTFVSTILKITYGMTISDDDDSYVRTAEIALASLAEAGHPGSFLVDLFPVMKYIPSWVPGAGWKRKANYWRQIGKMFVSMPWDFVKERMKEGTAEPCVATALLEKIPDENSPNRQDDELLARNVCALSFAGGADTTVSTVQSYFMAMALHPEVQKKAQEELDRVLGGRLPEFNDRPNLPYINAMVKESMRWQVVTPLAVAHMVSEADEYNGYYIPKEAYKDPLAYNPERFLKDGKIDRTVRDPTVASFGFGRRICPGRFLAEDSMFILISHILSVYDIRPGLDKDGKEIPIKPEMTNGLLSYPEPFTCRITPRSIEAEKLIRNSGLMD